MGVQIISAKFGSELTAQYHTEHKTIQFNEVTQTVIVAAQVVAALA